MLLLLDYMVNVYLTLFYKAIQLFSKILCHFAAFLEKTHMSW